MAAPRGGPQAHRMDDTRQKQRDDGDLRQAGAKGGRATTPVRPREGSSDGRRELASTGRASKGSGYCPQRTSTTLLRSSTVRMLGQARAGVLTMTAKISPGRGTQDRNGSQASA